MFAGPTMDNAEGGGKVSMIFVLLFKLPYAVSGHHLDGGSFLSFQLLRSNKARACSINLVCSIQNSEGEYHELICLSKLYASDKHIVVK